MPSGDLHPMTGQDALSPADVAFLVETRGVAKATAPVVTTFVLGVVAGAFIALGGVFAITIGTGSELGFGPTRLLAGVGFSLGLILVVVAGAELFTGNNLIVMSTVTGNIGVRRLLANWGVVYLGNAIGALSVVAMVYIGEWWRGDDLGIGVTALSTAAVKTSLPFFVVLARGILANALVCRRLACRRGPLGDRQGRGDRLPDLGVRCRRIRTQHRQHVLHPDGARPSRTGRGGGGGAPAECRAVDPRRCGTHQQPGRGDDRQRHRGSAARGLLYWFVYVRPTRAA